MHNDQLQDRAIAPDPTYWALRLGAAFCFIGHGAFGFITKAAWLPYFAVVGIPERWAWALMPLVGAVDVLAGMAVLFAPRSLPLLYMAVWALWTAMLRPLSGESVFELLERAGNYGVPLALLLMTGVPRSWRELLVPRQAGVVHATTRAQVALVLRWTTVVLLAGHGALGALLATPLLASHYATIGLAPQATIAVGSFELLLALVVAMRPSPWLLVFVAAWKVATESLFVVAGAPIWEFVERAGSYAAPLALATLLLATGRQTHRGRLVTADSS